MPELTSIALTLLLTCNKARITVFFYLAFFTTKRTSCDLIVYNLHYANYFGIRTADYTSTVYFICHVLLQVTSRTDTTNINYVFIVCFDISRRFIILNNRAQTICVRIFLIAVLWLRFLNLTFQSLDSATLACNLINQMICRLIRRFRPCKAKWITHDLLCLSLLSLFLLLTLRLRYTTIFCL